MEPIRGFWMYALVLVPLYIMLTLVGLYCVTRWLDGRIPFLVAAFTVGCCGWLAQPFVSELCKQALGELGFPRYCLLSIVNLVLWFAGLVGIILLRDVVNGLWDGWRRRLAHPNQPDSR